MKKFTIEEIKNAVDIVIGDDGMRSKEVIEILKQVLTNLIRSFNEVLVSLDSIFIALIISASNRVIFIFLFYLLIVFVSGRLELGA